MQILIGFFESESTQVICLPNQNIIIIKKRNENLQDLIGKSRKSGD